VLNMPEIVGLELVFHLSDVLKTLSCQGIDIKSNKNNELGLFLPILLAGTGISGICGYVRI